jgi:hypothetical protein
VVNGLAEQLNGGLCSILLDLHTCTTPCVSTSMKHASWLMPQDHTPLTPLSLRAAHFDLYQW